MLQRHSHAALNRGLVSRLGLAREDIERIALSTDVHVNWIPRVLGSMQIRPGLKWKSETLNSAQAIYIPFVFSNRDKAAIELTQNSLRVLIDDVAVTRVGVATTVINSDFTTDVNSWVNADQSGSFSSWEPGGYLHLGGNGSTFAIMRQNVTINLDDQNVEHAARVLVQAGPAQFRIGSTAGDDDFLPEILLEAGAYSLTFTPTGPNCWIEIKSKSTHSVLIDSIAIETGGDMTLPTPWLSEDLYYIRGGPDSQSGDIIFVAADGYQQWQIQRHTTRSWAMVLFQPEDGPFENDNVTSQTMTSTVIRGNGLLQSSEPHFVPGHIGALFRLASNGQTVTATVTAEDTFTNTILIDAETGTRRVFTVTRQGVFVATITLQRSFLSANGPWEDVDTYTTAAAVDKDDGLDGEKTWYRIGVKAGDFTSGSASVTLTYKFGTITGICRVTVYNTNIEVQMEVLSDMGNISATETWAEGSWSDVMGYPTSVCLYEGRLCWAGRDRFWASGSDAFYTYDNQGEGDAEPISRTIGSGAVDAINWMLPIGRLMMGGDSREFEIRSSSFDEILTPANCNIKPVSTQGSARVAAVHIDSRGLFIQRGGTRVFEMGLAEEGGYSATHLSAVVPEIGQPGVLKMVVQRQPDTRVHIIRSDGTVALLIFDKVEEVTCFCEVVTEGFVEDAFVLPGDEGAEEDQVYYVVARTRGALTARYLEKWALEEETRGLTDFVHLADAFITYDGAPESSNFAVGHLDGHQLVIWADGRDISRDANGNLIYTATDDPAGITPSLPTPASKAVIGLAYTADWRTTKLTRIQSPQGTVLTVTKKVQGIGLVMADIHARGLQFGPDFENLDSLARNFEGRNLDADEILVDREEMLMSFPGEWSSDARLCLRALAPRPCTVLAAVLEINSDA
jgi:hypothetical protein